MALLKATDRLTAQPRRVLVAGTSGSGKTTLARRIAAVLDVPYFEIDACYHGPGWTVRPGFASDVAELVAQPAWVTEWQYGQVRPLLAANADALVWLDLTRARVMWQVIRRTVRRRWRREQLWNGNFEPPLRTFFTDADHIVRWAWHTHPATAARVGAVLEERPELPVIRLTNHTAARAWVTGPLTAAHRENPRIPLQRNERLALLVFSCRVVGRYGTLPAPVQSRVLAQPPGLVLQR